MTFTYRIKQAIPFILLFCLLSLLCRELFSADKKELPSALVGEKIPAFSLPDIYGSGKKLTPASMKGHVSLLNVWASWCPACRSDHDMMMKIKNVYHVPIYSILYKDNLDDAKSYLKDVGNPYVITGDDSSGDASMDLGIYGTPETFIINPNGKIVYRHVGTISQSTWDTVFYPIIQGYRTKSKK